VSFDLSFWHEDQPITLDQARHIYTRLCDDDSTVVTAHPNVALFLAELTRHYPAIDDVPEDKLDDSPWSCAFSVTSGSAIVCMTWPAGTKLASFVIQLAMQHDLVCYDPQQDAVHSPASLS